jgi:hypothetical protein
MPKAKSTGDINVTTYMDDSYNHPSLMTTQWLMTHPFRPKEQFSLTHSHKLIVQRYTD